MRKLLLYAGLAAIAAGTVAWFLDGTPEPLNVETDPELTECVYCGTEAIWVNGRPVNPGPDDAPTFCIPLGTAPRPNRRIHGPFIPVIHVS